MRVLRGRVFIEVIHNICSGNQAYDIYGEWGYRKRIMRIKECRSSINIAEFPKTKTHSEIRRKRAISMRGAPLPKQTTSCLFILQATQSYNHPIHCLLSKLVVFQYAKSQFREIGGWYYSIFKIFKAEYTSVTMYYTQVNRPALACYQESNIRSLLLFLSIPIIVPVRPVTARLFGDFSSNVDVRAGRRRRRLRRLWRRRRRRRWRQRWRPWTWRRLSGVERVSSFLHGDSKKSMPMRPMV